MSVPTALRAFTHIEAPTSLSSAGTNKKTAVFRIPLDAHISASEAYLDVPLLTDAGTPAPPMFAGIPGTIDRAEATLGGTALRTVRRYGHRLQLLKAVGAGPTVVDSMASLTSTGGGPTLCYTPALDTVTGGNIGYNTLPSLSDAGSYARMTSHRGSARTNGAAAVDQPKATWRDQAGVNQCTADPNTTARGLVRLSRLFPELAVLPMGLLPRIAGGFLTMSITFRGDWAQDLSVGAGGPYATTQVSSDMRFVSRRFEFDSKTADMIEGAFLNYSAVFWESRLSEVAIPATIGVPGSQTQQSFDLGFQGERVGRLLLARSATLTADEARVVSELRANPIGRADTRLQLRVNDTTLFNRPLRHAEKWIETAAALDLARLRPPVGTYERITALDFSTEAEGGRLVYDNDTYGPVVEKLLSQFAPLAVDLRMDRSLPRVPQNGMETGRAGLVLDLVRIHMGGGSIADNAGTLYAWVEVGNVLSFSKGPGGMRVVINPL